MASIRDLIGHTIYYLGGAWTARKFNVPYIYIYIYILCIYVESALSYYSCSCCLSGERDCKFCVLMKKTLRYLAGVAGPSGYGSNSTAEQVTQQDCSFLLPSSQAQLTALVTENLLKKEFS
ncbi:unnamed protein product [Camellia sinensis]